MNRNVFWIIILIICEAVNIHTMSGNFYIGLLPFSICLIAIGFNVTALIKSK
jgi:hypothetical protein